MNHDVIRRSAICLLLAVAASAAKAQESETLSDDDAGQGTVIRTQLEAGATYTDNAYYSDDRFEPESAEGFRVIPGVTAAYILPRLRLTAGAEAELAWFNLPGTVDDYSDYKIGLGATWLSALRHKWSFSSGLRGDHDPFGLERTENTPLESRDLDKWRETNGAVGYRYGLPTDRYNIDVAVRGLNRTYTTNQAETQYLDYELAAGQLTGYYNITPKTALFATAIGARSMYEVVAPGRIDRSAIEVIYGAGAQWKATAKTTGEVRIGHVNHRPRSARDDFSAIDWLGAVTWSPRSYRSFELQTGRSSQESYLNDVLFLNNRYASLHWTEQWTQLLQSKLGARFLDSEFVDSSIDRVDRYWRLSLDLQYRLQRDLTLLMSAQSSIVNSDSAANSDTRFAEYDRFYGYIGARYSR